MAEHPVRLTVDDDLQRSRLTVFFRLLLAIPHLIWLGLWSILAVFLAIANWAVTVVRGRPSQTLHGYLTHYVRYWTHVFAYILLAANPYPGFIGEPGYPVDLEVDGPEQQSRLSAAFRLLLAFPAMLIALVFVGTMGPSGGEYGQTGGGGSEWWASGWSGGALFIVAVLAWFAAVATARMPKGFRDLQLYGIRFVAQTIAYGALLTDHYPNADPVDPSATGPQHPVRLRVDDDLRRSRLTVFFRLLLAIPHFVWLVLWGVAAIFAGLAIWVSALVSGRPPAPLHRFLSAFVRYSVHVSAYVLLTANPFPGFTGDRYPVDLQLPGPEPQGRVVTAFRLFLALPALIVSSALSSLLVVAAFLGWFYALVTGRMPHSFREAQAYALRYSAQAQSYLLLLTDRYPYSGPALGAPEPEFEPEPDAPAMPFPI